MSPEGTREIRSRSIDRFYVGGVRIDAVRMPGVLRTLESWIQGGGREYVVFQGAHGVIEARRDARLLAIDNAAGLAVPDGMPGVWLGRYKGHRDIERVYGPDVLLEAVQYGISRGWRHYFFGGKPGVAERLVDRLVAEYPGVRIAGCFAPPFLESTPEPNSETAAMIEATRPHFVWVGLGCPKQDYWMASFRPLLGAPALLGVGAAFDFLSGEVRMAPRWIQRTGFEWMYRALSEPRRLVRRYSDVVPRYLLLLGRELLRGRTSEP